MISKHFMHQVSLWKIEQGHIYHIFVKIEWIIQHRMRTHLIRLHHVFIQDLNDDAASLSHHIFVTQQAHTNQHTCPTYSNSASPSVWTNLQPTLRLQLYFPWPCTQRHLQVQSLEISSHIAGVINWNIIHDQKSFIQSPEHSEWTPQNKQNLTKSVSAKA